MSKIGVYIVDDHHLVREGFKSILQEYENEIKLLGEAKNGLELLHNLRENDALPHIVLLDINMPVMNGIEATQRLSKEFPDIKVIALTMIKQSTYIKHMLKAGAMGYILKDCDRDELLTALRTVVKNESYFSKSVSMEVMLELTKIRKNAQKKDTVLSKRELEVLDLIVKDLSNKQIADKLHISARTVDTHKQNILLKTGTKSIAGLVVFAIKNNLVELPE